MNMKVGNLFSIIILLVGFCYASMLPHLKLKEAIIYDRSAPNQKILFKLKRNIQIANPHKTIEDTFTDTSGNIVAIERFKYLGELLESYELKDHQTGVEGKVTLSNGNAAFEVKTKKEDGTESIKKSQESLSPNTLSKNQIVDYLVNNWDKLVQNETINIRLLVVDRAETVGFKFFKDHETTYDGKKIVVIKMKPSSILIAALVDPLYFTFEEKAPHMLLEVNGRVLPKQLVDGKYSDLDAVTVFKYF